MVRASIYLGASALIWFAEGFLFSRFLAFSPWQTVILGLFYVVLFAGSLWLLRDFVQHREVAPDGIATWRILSLAPMVTTVLGSFLSLPVVLAVLAMGKLG